MQHASIVGSGCEILTSEQMACADKLTICHGVHSGYDLMCNAGAGVVAALMARYADAQCFNILCGPGNNGGDGYVVARLLKMAGLNVSVYSDSKPKQGSDAALAAENYDGMIYQLSNFQPDENAIIIDALYGAGLSKPLGLEAARVARAVNASAAPVVAIDLPSGVSGTSGMVLGDAFVADLTITFFRLKPGHLLEPGRGHCGEIHLVDIGIDQKVLTEITPLVFRNLPALWQNALPKPDPKQHKYSRGHTAVFSGEMPSTGAARLSALAAARIGAGAVTLFSPANAVSVNAAHLTSIMLREINHPDEVSDTLQKKPPRSVVLGPGFGLSRPIKEYVKAILMSGNRGVLVLDADGISAFSDDPSELFHEVKMSAWDVVITPHEGEFARLFPELLRQNTSKLDRALEAAKVSGCTVVYKGPDTVIAAPSGWAAINENGTPLLATAGSGDVLAGLIAGLASQEMPIWQACCSAVWIHCEAAKTFGPGLIAEDLADQVPAILRGLL